MARSLNGSTEIYSFRRYLNRLLRKSRPILRQFVTYLKAVEGLGEARQLKHLQNIIRFERRYLEKALEICSSSEFKNAVYKLIDDELDSDTKYIYKTSLKKFFQFLLSEQEKNSRRKVWRKNFEFIKKIKIKPSEPKIEPISEIEFRKMYEAAEDLQMRAIISLLYECGLRSGELLSLKVGDVHLHEDYAEIYVYGKTGEGVVIALKSYRDLVNHLENHPFANNPNAPLWFIRKSGKIQAMTYGALRMRIRRLAERAGIGRRIWPHLFRHTSATQKSKFLTDREMCILFRWKENSKMPARYSHLAQRDVRSKLLSLYKSESIQDVKPKVSKCWKCGELLQDGVRFCPRCGSPQQISEVYQKILQRKEADELMNVLINDPEVREAIWNALKRLYAHENKEVLSFQGLPEPNVGEAVDYSSSNQRSYNNKINR